MGAYFSVVNGSINEADGLKDNYTDGTESAALKKSNAYSWAPRLLHALFHVGFASLGINILIA